MRDELQFELSDRPGMGFGRKSGLSLSIGVHVLLFLLVFFNPDFLRSTPTRIIRIAGQDYERDRFEDFQLILPPEAIIPVPQTPEVAEAQPPEVAVPPAPAVEAAPPPPPPPPPPEEEPPSAPPPPLIGPDDVVAEGARPDAGDSEQQARQPGERPEEFAIVEAGEDGDPNQPDGSGLPEESSPGAVEEPASPNQTAELADNTNPDALVLPDFRERAESIVEQNVAQERRMAAQGRRSGGARGVQEVPDFTTEEPTILSDTRGYDFGPFMNQVVNRVRVNWYSLIPQAARLRQVRGRVVLIFTITATGDVTDLRVVSDSGTVSLDRAATAAITASNPFPRLPPDYDDDHIVLQFTFLYNMTD